MGVLLGLGEEKERTMPGGLMSAKHTAASGTKALRD